MARWATSELFLALQRSRWLLRSVYGRVLVCLVRFLCSIVFMSGIYYYTRRKVFASLKVYFIYLFCTGFIFIGFSLFIVLWNIAQAAFLQLLAGKEPTCDDVDGQ